MLPRLRQEGFRLRSHKGCANGGRQREAHMNPTCTILQPTFVPTTLDELLKSESVSTDNKNTPCYESQELTPRLDSQ